MESMLTHALVSGNSSLWHWEQNWGELNPCFHFRYFPWQKATSYLLFGTGTKNETE